MFFISISLVDKKVTIILLTLLSSLIILILILSLVKDLIKIILLLNRLIIIFELFGSFGQRTAVNWIIFWSFGKVERIVVGVIILFHEHWIECRRLLRQQVFHRLDSRLGMRRWFDRCLCQQTFLAGGIIVNILPWVLHQSQLVFLCNVTFLNRVNWVLAR